MNRAEWHQAQAGGRPPEPALIRVTRWQANRGAGHRPGGVATPIPGPD